MTLSCHQVHCSLSSLFPTSIPSKIPPLVVSFPSPKTHTKTDLKELCRRDSLKEAFSVLFDSLDRKPFSHSPEEDYSYILELCAFQKAAAQGQQIHAHLLKSSFWYGDGFLCTRLLFMYAKCGLLHAAQQLFDELPQRTIFAWNALLWAYASVGETERAIRLYCNMRILCEVPDGCTFAGVLKACRLVDHLYYGLHIHSLSVKCGLISSSFVANGLLHMYGKCGQFDLAEKLFEGLPKKQDLVLWNSIISGSIQSAKYAKAIALFREMYKTGMRMDSYTAVSVLQACAELSLVKLGREVHGSLLRCRGSLELYEGNALVIMYAKNGFLPHAVQVFNEMNEKDDISWNSLLSAFVQNCFYLKAIELFCRMLEMGYMPDPITLVVVASASARLGNLLNGMEIHGYAIKQGHDSDIQMANTLMAIYTKCSLVKNCELLFQRILNKDVISWTTMIACYAQNGYYIEAVEFFRRVQEEGTEADPLMIGSILQACSGLVSPSFLKQIHGYTIRHGLLDLILKNTVIDVYGECGMVGHALKVFQGIKDKDVVSWTSMITCYVRNRLFNDALILFGNMIKANVHPDVVALLGVLSAAAGLASLTKGKEVHAFLIRRSMCVDGNLSSLLVDMYARCGKIDESFKVFEKIGCKGLVLWTSIVDACGMHGMGREAVDLFERMEEAGIVPDHVAFLALLYACSHSRLVVEGKHFFEKMIKDYNLKPWPEHYTCIVDLLGRAGKVEEAYKFIKKMPIKSTAAIWCAFLGACRVYSSYKLGKLAAEKLLDLEPENPGNYVLIANSLAAMGKWEEVKKLRSEMREKGIKKEPGCSWIEVGTNFHVFRARDKLHEASSTIYSKLAEITQVLEKEGGYVPDTSFVLHDVKEEEKVRMLHAHSERLAIAFGLIRVPHGSIIRITKNLRVCGDCHEFTKLVSKLFGRDITVRDANRFHHFRNGSCSCGDFW